MRSVRVSPGLFGKGREQASCDRAGAIVAKLPLRACPGSARIIAPRLWRPRPFRSGSKRDERKAKLTKGRPSIRTDLETRHAHPLAVFASHPRSSGHYSMGEHQDRLSSPSSRPRRPYPLFQHLQHAVGSLVPTLLIGITLCFEVRLRLFPLLLPIGPPNFLGAHLGRRAKARRNPVFKAAKDNYMRYQAGSRASGRIALDGRR